MKVKGTKWHTRKSFKGVVVEVGEEKDTVVVC